MKRLARRFRERRWVMRRHDEDKRPYFEAVHLFQASDEDEADALWERMCEALGCNDETCGADKQCPHFRFGALHRLDDD